MNVLAGLMDPSKIGQDIQTAFQSGRDMARQQQAESALSAYAANPDDPNAFQGLAKYAPKIAIQVRGDMQKREQDRLLASTRVAVATGRAPASDLAAMDFDGYQSFTKEQRAIAEGNAKTVGNMALMADSPEKWDATVRNLGPDYAKYVGRFDLRETVISNANMAKDYLAQNAPQFITPGYDEDLVNIKDPAAIAAFNQSRMERSAGAPQETKVINGNTYYNVGGKWFDELPKGGSVGNGTGGF